MSSEDLVVSIPAHSISYRAGDDFATGSYATQFSADCHSDTSVIQMGPEFWKAPSSLISGVFNGWYVEYALNGNVYKLTVSESNGAYAYSFESDASAKVKAAVMPGDGIVFGTAGSYDAADGVLTVPDGCNLTFTARWSESHLYESTILGNPESISDYNPITGAGSVFTNIISFNNSLTLYYNLSLNGKAITIQGTNSSSTLNMNLNNLTGDLYLRNLKINKSSNLGDGIFAQGHHLIIGENVSTSYTYDYLSSNGKPINDDPGVTCGGFIVSGGFSSGDNKTNTHLVILSGDYSAVFGANYNGTLNGDTYISAGHPALKSGPRIFSIYGSSFTAALNGHTNILVSGTADTDANPSLNQTTVSELIGGTRNSGTVYTNNIEILGGRIHDLNGGSRGRSAHVTGTPNDDGTFNSNEPVITIYVSGGYIERLFGGPKDGNVDAKSYPVNGNIYVAVSNGKIDKLFGGGYDFWGIPNYSGINGKIRINVGMGTTDVHAEIGDLYGGGYRGPVGENPSDYKPSGYNPAQPISTEIISLNIGGYAEIGNVYGGGSGGKDDSTNNGGNAWDETTGRSYVFGSVDVNIGEHSKITGNVFGGGMGVNKSSAMYLDGTVHTDISAFYDVATVFGNTDVAISGSAVIEGSIFGAGKGVSKSVWIGYDATQHSESSIISSRLYNIIDDKYKPNSDLDSALYQWEYYDKNSNSFIIFSQPAETDNLDLTSLLSYSDPYKTVRLKMTIDDTNETVYSNVINASWDYYGVRYDSQLPLQTWENWNKELVQIAAVTGNTNVTVLNGTVSGNVFGGGSYALAGKFTTVSDIDQKEYHTLSGNAESGNTNVTVLNGTVSGNVFGGGMGEPDNITAGSVGYSSSVLIGGGSSAPSVGGNIYGGGENGFVGGTIVIIDLNNSNGSVMMPVTISNGDGNEIKTNTYCYNLSISYNDSHTGDKDQTPGTSTVVIRGLNAATDENKHNIYGGGYGENATVTGKSSVVISGGTVSNVYGGGELGVTGQLAGRGTGSAISFKGGESSIKICGNSSSTVTINGSVYGGGKGKFTLSPDDAVLGAVGNSASVSISSDKKENVKITGSVYGGGELSIVGSYALSGGTDEHPEYLFSGGDTTVKITGGTIYQNVYGGGRGSPYNIVSGAVGNTNVIIDGNSKYTISDGFVSEQTQIGHVESTSETNIKAEHIEASVSTGTKDVGHFEPETGYLFIGVLQPENGSIIVKNPKGIMLTPNHQHSVQNSENKTETYDVYKIPRFEVDKSGNMINADVNLDLTYNSDSGYYVKTWYNVSDASGSYDTEKSNIFVGKDDTTESITVWVEESNNYYVTVADPTFGKITVSNNDGSNLTKIENTNSYEVMYGANLTFTCSYADEDKHFVKKWVTNPVNDIICSDSNPAVAYLTVTGDVTVSVFEGPAVGNVYGGGAYGFVGKDIKVRLIDETNHPIIDTKNESYTNVIILGGKIGAERAGSIATGNVYGGGYGPNAFVAGSTNIYIGKSSVPSTDSKLQSLISGMSGSGAGSHGNIYGGGEMGPVGVKIDGSDPNVKTNISISSSKNNDVIIGHITFEADSSTDPEALYSDVRGNIFGGGEGGDLPQYIINLERPDQAVPLIEDSGVSPGHAVVYGTTYIKISGIKVNTGISAIDSLGQWSTTVVSGGVYGGGEGVIKADMTDTAKGMVSSIPYGQVIGNDGDTASHIYIDDATVMRTVFGGGKLGILGTYDSGQFKGKDTFVFISGFILSNVYGGGEGHVNSAISGAVGSTLVVLDGNAQVGVTEEHSVGGPSGLIITGGNVYGGGRLSVTGSFKIDVNRPGVITPSFETGVHKDNSAATRVIILGGTVYNSVYGGGFSPKATIAGSTHVDIGDHSAKIVNGSERGTYCSQSAYDFLRSCSKNLNAAAVIICKDVYGGGEMGSVGTTVLESFGDDADHGKQLNPEYQTDTYTDADGNIHRTWVSANVNITSNLNKITIGYKFDTQNSGNSAPGNVYGGGKGIVDSEVNNIRGYALIRGNTQVTVDGSKGSIAVNGDVYGGGKGAQKDYESIHYAEVYDFTDVKVNSAAVTGSVYGGGELGIIGHFVDNLPAYGEEITITQIESGKSTLVTGKVSFVDSATGKVSITYNDESGTEKTISDLEITNREFCGDNAVKYGTSYKSGAKAYTGEGTAKVSILDSMINGNVFGGGKGLQSNILAGAVGRGTEVTIKVTPSGADGTIVIEDNLKTVIGTKTSAELDTGYVYGGGEYGIVGSITNQIVGKGAFSPVKVIHVSHVKDLSSFDSSKPDLDKGNDIEQIVNIHGGTIYNSVYGAGRGEPIRLEGVDYGNLTIVYYKLSSFGRSEVNVSNGRILSSVYGGSQNGEAGSFTVLQNAQDFTNKYWTDNNKPYAEPSKVPVKARDEYYKAGSLPTFSATFVNLIGGEIGGNVFGGGYFGAIYGTAHVHMGWNAMMPLDDTKGDCHYYNNYDGNFGGDTDNPDAILPFDKSKRESLVSNLFIKGSVFAGGDRGDPKTPDYSYITIYGTSHVLLNGTGYAAGTNVLTVDDIAAGKLAAMYVTGSLFGSGNSCTTFCDNINMSRFITIKNYQAVEKSTEFALFSIQRASNVTLINSKLRLTGRSDGANDDSTKLYSLSHVYSLTLQSINEGSSQLILDVETQDLREIVSQVYRGDQVKYENTDALNSYNIIQLNKGITLTVQIKEEKDKNNASAPFRNDPERYFGPVKGYFYLNVERLDYYNAYVYGQRQIADADSTDNPDYKYVEGGFVYGLSFDGLSGKIQTNESIAEGATDYSKTTYGYRAWLPSGGGGHLTETTTLVAKNDASVTDPSGTSKNVYINKGSVTLPMAEPGSRYKLIGYNIYPAQATGLNDDKRSLKLVSGDSSLGDTFDGTDKNTTFKLKVTAGAGFDSDNSFWFSDNGSIGEEHVTQNTTGTAPPQFEFELYSQGVTRTAIAGNVVMIIQEMKNTGETDSDGSIIFKPGDEINLTIAIETQADSFGEEVSPGGSRYEVNKTNYEDSTTLYVNSQGAYPLQYLFPPLSGSDKYTFTLNDISYDTSKFELVKDKASITKINQYAVSITPNLVKGVNGWNHMDLQGETFIDPANSDRIQIGTTDGRWPAGMMITLYCMQPATNKPVTEQDYPTGLITLNIGYNKIPTATSPDSVSGTIYIDNEINAQLEIYTVSFVPGTEVQSFPQIQINSGDNLNDNQYDNQMNYINYNTPQKEGETFAGWYKWTGEYDKDGNPILDSGQFNFGTPIYSNTTLYAKYKHVVTFHYGYDRTTEDQTVEVIDRLDVGADGKVDDSKLTADNKNRAGYKFVKWIYNGSEFDPAAAIVSSSIDVYAEWKAINYTIIFDKNEGRTDGPNSVTGDLPADVTFTLDDKSVSVSHYSYSADGYTFGGWSADKNATSGFTAFNPNTITRDDVKYEITLYAIWTQKPVVEVQFDKSDASAVISYKDYVNNVDPNDIEWTSAGGNTFLVTKGNNVMIKIENLNADGKYQFKSASLTQGTDTVSTLSNSSTDDAIVILDLGKISEDRAVVSVNLDGQIHAVKLELDGGSFGTDSSIIIPSIDVTYGEKYSELAGIIITRAGYKFESKWYLNSDKEKIITSDSISDIIDDKSTLTAVYIAEAYDIYVTTKDNVNVTLTGTTGITIPQNYSKPDAISGVKASPVNDFTFGVLVFTGCTNQELKDILTITVGEGADVKTLTYGEPDAGDYSIGSSSSSSDGTTSSVTIYKSAITGSIRISLESPEINKYRFSGIVKDADGNALSGVTVTLTDASGNVVGTFTSLNDGTYTMENITHNTQASLSASLWGYTFAPEDKTFTADVDDYEINLSNDLHVEYDLNGGTGDVTDSTAYAPTDGTIDLKYLLDNNNTITRTGYTFMGWALVKEPGVGDTTYVSGTNGSYTINKDASPDKDSNFKGEKDNTITFYAVWEANTYQIIYHRNGGSTSDSNNSYTQTWTFGTELKLSPNNVSPDVFTYDEHNFLGWNKSNTATSPEYAAGETITVTAENLETFFPLDTASGDISGKMELYAVWEEKEYTVWIKDTLDDGKIPFVTSSYRTFIFNVNKGEDPIVKNCIELEFTNGQGYTGKAPKGTYSIYFALVDPVTPSETSLDYLAVVDEKLEVTGGNDAPADGYVQSVQLWSVHFNLYGMNENNNNSSGSYEDKSIYIDLNSGSSTHNLIVVNNRYPYQYNAPPPVVSLPTNNDYYFDGWYVEDGAGGYKIWDTDKVIGGHLEVYAKWVKKELRIVFGDGTEDSKHSVYSGKNQDNIEVKVFEDYLLGPDSSPSDLNFIKHADLLSTTLKDYEKTYQSFVHGWYDAETDGNKVIDLINAGDYYYRASADHSKKISVSEPAPDRPHSIVTIEADTLGNSTCTDSEKYTINKLPIFIVPKEGQWKYYGYDLTSGSINGIYVGESITPYSTLQYDVYNYSDRDNPIRIQTSEFSDTLGIGYAKINGSLDSDMLDPYTPASSTGYAIMIGSIAMDNNSNYEIYYYPEGNAPVNSGTVVLGAGANSLPPLSTVEVKPRSVTITVNSTVEYNGTTSFNNLSSLKYTLGDIKLADGDKITSFNLTVPSPLVNTYNIGIQSGGASLTANVVNASAEDIAASYSFTYAGSIEITTKTLTLDVSLSSTYNGTSEFTFTGLSISNNVNVTPDGATGNIIVSGLISGDIITELKIKTNGKYIGPHTLNDNDVTVSVSNNDTQSSNRSNCYVVTLNTKSFTVEKKELTITESGDHEKIYDGNVNLTLTPSIKDGKLDADTVSVTFVSALFDDKNVGENKDLTLTLSLSGTDAGNYKLNSEYTAGEGSSYTHKYTDGKITPKAIIIEITKIKQFNGEKWQYNFVGTTPEWLVTGDAIESGILETTSGVAKEYTSTDADLGTDFIWTQDLDTINGIENYSITYDLHVTITDNEKYRVEFDSNGGSTVNSVDVASGSKITKPADPTKSGYKFAGWFKDEALTEEWNFESDTVTENTTLYAKWEPKDTPTPTVYKVEYSANGGEGEVPKPELHFAGEFVTVKSADLKRDGYTFKGWCDSYSQISYKADETFRMPSRDVCLTAVWEENKPPIQGKEVTVTFIVDNEVYGKSTTHINTILNGAMQPDPVKEGYDFLGWYTKDGRIFTSQTIVKDDMTVYAKFELNEDYVLVTYIIDKEIYMTLACKKSIITEPNVSAGIGKELNGWYTDEELKNKFDFNSIVKEDSLTLYAEWENNSDFILIAAMLVIFFLILLIILLTKRISFYESLESEKKFDSAVIFWKGMLKEKLPLPPSSSKEFAGWYSEEGELITAETEIRHSMKLYARWKD